MDSNRVRPYIVKALKYICDMCNDQASESICLSQMSEIFVSSNEELQLMKILTKIPCFGYFFYKILVDKVYFNYEFIVTLLECSEHINTELSHMSHSLDYKKEIGELREEISQNVTDFV